jgi:hypothetical protein
MTFRWIAVALPLAYMFALFYVLPHLSRRTQFFAVTVPAGFRQSDGARAILLSYHRQVTVHCALGICGMAVVALRGAVNWLILPFLWPAAGGLVAIALAHRAALRYAAPPAAVRSASLRPRPRSLPGGPLAWAGPFAILAAAGVYIRLHWSEIPARFPIHWGLDGRPNGWGVRSLAGVYQTSAIGVFTCLLMWFVAWQIAVNSRGSTAMRRLNVRLMLTISYSMAALFGWLTVSLPLGHGAPNTAMLIIVAGAFPLGLGAIIVVLGMRAKHEPEPERDLTPAPDSPGALSGDNSADRNWKAGLLYFNPEDPALFVEKRIGIGYDLNFGNPRAWAFIGIVVLIPAMLALIRKL